MERDTEVIRPKTGTEKVREESMTSGSSASDQARDKAQQVSGQAQAKAGEYADQAQAKAGQYADQAKGQAKSQIGTRKDWAADQLDGITQALGDTSQHLREQDQGAIGNYTDKVAGYTERLSGYLRNTDPDALIRDAENLARRQPALFLGGAFAIGVLGARFLKSSSEEGT